MGISLGENPCFGSIANERPSAIVQLSATPDNEARVTQGAISMRLLLAASVLLIAGCGSKGTPDPLTPFGKFEGRVVTVWEDDSRNMRLEEDFAYVDARGKRWLAPKGSTVNGASIPQAFWSVIGGPFEGPFRNASVVHDVGCDERTEAWESVHRMFHDACRCGGVTPKKAKLMYWAVYNFGPRWPGPGEPRMHTFAAPPEPDQDLVNRAAQYFEDNDPPVDEIPSLSRDGGPLDPESVGADTGAPDTR
jgi:hypothetical protein